MNAIDSPIDALAFNYLSYGFLTAVNNIWAWVAVITAAVSFWRIRALSISPLVSRPEQRGNSQYVVSLPPPKVSAVEAAEPPTISTKAATTTTTPCRLLKNIGSPKVKFCLYYNERECMESDDCGEDECIGGRNGGRAVVRGNYADDRERMMVVRMGDMGWYKYQDLTVLNGSVVRLWDGRRRPRCGGKLVLDGGVEW